jgi:hypothetical protein
VSGSFGLSPDGARLRANDALYDLAGTGAPKRGRQFADSEVLLDADAQIITTKDGKISFWNPADGKLQRGFDAGSPQFLFHSDSTAAGDLLLSDVLGVHVRDLPAGKRLVIATGKHTVRDPFRRFQWGE